MLRARLTSRGRVTIPIEVRVRYQLRSGDEIDFRADGSSVRLVPLTKRNLSRALGARLHRRLPRR